MLNQIEATSRTSVINICDIIGDAKVSTQKAIHMLNLFMKDYDFSDVADPYVTVLGMQGKPIKKWNDDERNMFEWLQNSGEITNTIGIVDDYVCKTLNILDSACEALQESIQAIPDNASESTVLAINFMNTLTEQQKLAFLDVEASIVKRVINEIQDLGCDIEKYLQ